VDDIPKRVQALASDEVLSTIIPHFASLKGPQELTNELEPKGSPRKFLLVFTGPAS
jgi:hypothetical protein